MLLKLKRISSPAYFKVQNPSFSLLADFVLILHTAVAAFVVLGLPLIWLGNARNWHWVNRLWFRLLHLGTIAFVVIQSLLGMICPLTILENWLRTQAGQIDRGASFIEYWFTRILFYQAPSEVFTLSYTLFGLAVVWTWWKFPPRR